MFSPRDKIPLSNPGGNYGNIEGDLNSIAPPDSPIDPKDPSKWLVEFDNVWKKKVKQESFAISDAVSLAFDYVVERRLAFKDSEYKELRLNQPVPRRVYEGPEEEFYERMYFSAVSLLQSPPQYSFTGGDSVAGIVQYVIAWSQAKEGRDLEMELEGEGMIPGIARLIMVEAARRGKLDVDSFPIFQREIIGYQKGDKVMLDGLEFMFKEYSGDGMLVLQPSSDVDFAKGYNLLGQYGRFGRISPRIAKEVLIKVGSN